MPDILLDMLADGVLAQPMPALALQVKEAGPHKLRRAIELAEALLGSQPTARSQPPGHHEEARGISR